MKVWVFQTGEPLHTDLDLIRPMRAMNISDKLIEHGHEVVLWSSAFYHQKKFHRSQTFESLSISERLQVNLIPSKGYKNNIGIDRIIDHFELGNNLACELKNIDPSQFPDVAFVGFPPIEFAKAASDFLTQKNIPYMLDAKDMWPDYFVEKIPRIFRFLGRFIFAHWYHWSRIIFKNADAFSTISQGYLDWMYKMGERGSSDFDCVSPTSTSYADFDAIDDQRHIKNWQNRGIRLGEHKIIFYAGTINKTLDLDPVLEVARKLDCSEELFRIVICGDGPEKEPLMRKFESLDSVIFTGWVDKEMLHTMAKNSLASLIPYRDSDTFALGIPNKLSDALSMGIPVISCLGGEVKNLIHEYDIGSFYSQKSSDELFYCVLEYLRSPEMVARQSANAKKLYQKSFDASVIYENLAIKLEYLADKGPFSMREKNE